MGMTLTENWWIGIEGACGNTVFLHEYASPDMPEHKKIIAIDALTGSCRWIEEQLSFVTAHGMSVYGKKNLFEDEYLYELNIADGSLVRKIDSARNPVPPDPMPSSHAQPEYPRYAETTAELPPYWKTLVEQAGVGTNGVIGLEYLDHQTFVVLSWYERQSRNPGDMSMRLLLKILGEDGSVRYTDTIEENAVAIIPETFCMTGDRLMYIKERTSLRSVNLGTEE